MMWDMPDYFGTMGATSQGTGHSKGLRLILKQARDQQGLSAKAVGERIALHLQALGDADAEPVSPSTIYAWESFDRHPSIANFAAWARVLGYRLIVELDSATSDRAPVLVRTDEAAEAARRIDLMQPDQRAAILGVIRSMSPSPPDE